MRATKTELSGKGATPSFSGSSVSHRARRRGDHNYCIAVTAIGTSRTSGNVRVAQTRPYDAWLLCFPLTLPHEVRNLEGGWDILFSAQSGQRVRLRNSLS